MTHAGRAASSPEIFWPFLTVCLTVFPFEFRPRTFTIEFYEKKAFISELMILEWSFPLSIGYRLRWRSDIWSTNRGAAEVGTPDIRPTTEDDIRHNATTQDKDLLRIIIPFGFRFYFHYRMLRKKPKKSVRSFFAKILLVVVVIVEYEL